MSEQALRLRLVRVRRISGQIEVVTGLRIGSGLPPSIGVVDYPIVRTAESEEPYIPGSSLKGKMRHLLEWHLGSVRDDGSPWHVNSPDDAITRVFGGPASSQHATGPTRLLVRDARLAEDSRQAMRTGARPVVEIKFENSVNRLTAEASGRPVERVVPGVRFDFEILYRVFDTGDGGERDESLLKGAVLTGLALIEQDCLGGSGSRGYGSVRFLAAQDGQVRPGVLVDGERAELPNIVSD
jgi:CRISPR-associated protein Csm3